MDEPQNYSLPLCRLLVNILYSGTISYILMPLYENYIFCDVVLGFGYLKRLNRIAGETAPFSITGCAEAHAMEFTTH